MTEKELIQQYGPRESMAYDVVIVGAGVAGLATAIHLKQQAQQQQTEISVAVLEKGGEVGSHILSGCVMDMRALTELLPNWQQLKPPIKQAVKADELLFLTKNKAVKFASWMVPACFKNHGNYIVSLAQLTRWLAQTAEQMGVEIFPGFAAASVVYDDQGAVTGVVTSNMGLDKQHQPTANFQLGVEISAKYTVFAEGSRGSLSQQVLAKYSLAAAVDPQYYVLGIKEVWQIEPALHQAGLVTHTVGWPLSNANYGGGFVYHAPDNKLYLGLAVGLDYSNPYFNPFAAMQQFKTHPRIKGLLQGQAKRLAYGARTMTAGGLSCLPKLTFPGGLLVGCSAGFLNASRIKGSHAAIKSGMLAAQALAEAILAGHSHNQLSAYEKAFKSSWLYKELNKGRNFKQWFSLHRWLGFAMTAVEQWLLRGKFFWTLHRRKADHQYLRPALQCDPIAYPQPDGKITFDKLSSLALSNVYHPESQPNHLVVKDQCQAVTLNYQQFAAADTRYCPAGVYEYLTQDGQVRLQINATNCLHCKTCDAKDYSQNISWTVPESGGPSYSDM